jgi:transketolase
VRDAFFRALAELAANDERVWALTGDLGIGLFDEIERAAPGRVLNVGIAEQALVGIAAGLAYAGKVPCAYSIAPFVTSRPYDQIRVDVAMARANVKLVGVGGGLAYGYLGPTHHAIEDLALMRALPGMTVLAPGDPAETLWATRAAFALDGPVYLRLGKNGEPSVLPRDATFAVGRALTLRTGEDVTLACTGAIVAEALDAADRLAASGIDATVLHFGTVKPFDADALAAAAAITGALVTIEEHSIIGGLGSAAAEALAERGVGARLRRVGLRDEFAHAVGSHAHLLRHYGLAAPQIAKAADGLLALRRGNAWDERALADDTLGQIAATAGRIGASR